MKPIPAAAAKPQKNLANGVRFCCDKPPGSIIEVSRTAEANGKRTYQSLGSTGEEEWVCAQVGDSIFQMRGDGSSNACRWVRKNVS